MFEKDSDLDGKCRRPLSGSAKHAGGRGGQAAGERPAAPSLSPCAFLSTRAPTGQKDPGAISWGTNAGKHAGQMAEGGGVGTTRGGKD